MAERKAVYEIKNVSKIFENDGKDYGYVINEDLSKTFKLDQERFETYDFSINDGINWVIKKISKIEEGNHISLLNADGYLPQLQYF